MRAATKEAIFMGVGTLAVVGAIVSLVLTLGDKAQAASAIPARPPALPPQGQPSTRVPSSAWKPALPPWKSKRYRAVAFWGPTSAGLTEDTLVAALGDWVNVIPYAPFSADPSDWPTQGTLASNEVHFEGDFRGVPNAGLVYQLVDQRTGQVIGAMTVGVVGGMYEAA